MNVAPPVGRPDARTSANDPDQLARWRLISLEKQLPTPRALTGLGTPVAVGSILIALLAAFAFVYLDRVSPAGVPRAVSESQRQFVEGLSRSINNSVGRSRDELEQVARSHDSRPDRVKAILTDMVAEQPKWRGAVVTDASGGTQKAAAGQPVTVPPGITATRAALPLVDGNDPRLLLVEPLADGSLLIGELDMGVRSLRLDPRSRQAILIAVPSGDRALAQGAPVQGGPVEALLGEVLGALGDERSVARSGAAAPPPAGDPAKQPVAPVVTASVVGSLGFSVVSVVYSPVTADTVSREPLVTTAVLLVAALLVLLVVQLGLVRPVRRLLDHAKAVASGNPTAGPLRTASREANRIGAAFDTLAAERDGRAGSRQDGPRGGVGSVWSVVAATLVILAACGLIVVNLAPAERDLPSQVVRDTENQAAAVASVVSDILDGGFAQLAQAGRENSKASPSAMGKVLERLVDENPRFRSAYLVSADGATLTTAGREPMRPAGQVPGESGVTLYDVRGRLPIVFAYYQLSDGRGLAAEYDVRYLSRLLDRMEGRVQVLDIDQRDILDTSGYLAFEQVTTDAVRKAAASALTGKPYADVVEIDGRREMLVATPVSLEGTTAQLEWTVVARRPVADYALPNNALRQGSLLVIVVAAGIALLLVSWHYFFQLRPLRNLSREAAALAGGKTSQAISPRWHDEIGAVAVCLEVCRQAAVHGEQRLGGAVRLRGVEGMNTVIMTKVPERRRNPRKGS
ncbi:HAMP domain-containing protein [Micromonospora sp. B11E3]|uniref:HAMP domain-containing protein n=1 Tax=Micromonospora sp. B11E3 TaxID=3153562 RepID=UPI00325F137D